MAYAPKLALDSQDVPSEIERLADYVNDNAVLDSGAQTIAGAKTFSDAIIPSGGIRPAPVAIPDAATYTVLAANSGKTHLLPNLTADIVIDFPTPVAGLEYEFVYKGVAADAQDWQFDTLSATNFYLGGVVHLDTDAGSAGDEVVPVAPDGNSNALLNVLVPDVGTRVKFICDGTNWIVSGYVVAATAPTFADLP